MLRYIADTETNGLLPDLTTIHSLVLRNIDEPEDVISCHDAFDPALNCRPSIEEGLEEMNKADLIVGHNWIKFDALAIQKVYPEFKPTYQVRDTILMSRLAWPEIKQSDFKRWKRGNLPGQMIGRYSLESWGHRLGLHKGDYSKDMAAKGLDPWVKWNPAMQDYCELDTEVTLALWQLLHRRPYAEQALELEHRFAEVMVLMELAGFPFNEKEAAKLFAMLVEKQSVVERELQDIFPPDVVDTKSHWWEVKYKPGNPYSDTLLFGTKKEAKEAGYKDRHITKGPLKTKEVPFNPGSRMDIADRLTRKYGWRPTEFTPDGKVKVDETILGEMTDWPEAQKLTEYLMLGKRLGQIGTGKEALLKHVKSDGKIHGTINTVGAVTRRCSHSKPNVAQVPKVGSEYGIEFRTLFTTITGWMLVGCDASGIELRMLAHYMARYDGGAYIKAVIEGKQEDETDVHSLNAKALGLESQKVYHLPGGRSAKGRDLAKTFIYAFLYGAGDAKLGSILGRGKKEGAALKRGFLKAFPALAKLKKKVAETVAKNHSLNAIDGGRLQIRHKHAALNTLLQSAGAIAVKQATVLFYDAAIKAGFQWGIDFMIVAHIHDELQILTREGIENDIGKLASQAMRDAGPSLGFRCPLDGDYQVGRTWAETH